jgi:hypothetical protein
MDVSLSLPMQPSLPRSKSSREATLGTPACHRARNSAEREYPAVPLRDSTRYIAPDGSDGSREDTCALVAVFPDRPL